MFKSPVAFLVAASFLVVFGIAATALDFWLFALITAALVVLVSLLPRTGQSQGL